MHTKIPSVFFIKWRAAGSAVAPRTAKVEGGRDTKIGTTVTTMADSVRPLLTSMKLFGLYFRCRTEADDNVASERSRRWNVHMVYSLVVGILLWINVARMFSVFTNTLIWSLLACSLMFCLLCLLYLSSTDVDMYFLSNFSDPLLC